MGLGILVNSCILSKLTWPLLTSTEKYFSIKLNEALYTDSFSWLCSASILSKPPHSSIIMLSFSVSPSFSAALKQNAIQGYYHNSIFIRTSISINIYQTREAGVMAQQLKALVTLPENPGSIFNFNTSVYN